MFVNVLSTYSVYSVLAYVQHAKHQFDVVHSAQSYRLEAGQRLPRQYY